MKTKLVILGLFLGALSLNSCQKEYMGPLDANGQPILTRDGEIGTGTEGGTDGITDGGHDSDYDGSSKGRRKPASPTN